MRKKASQVNKKYVVNAVLLLIGYFLFQEFIWNKYIVNPTVSDALQDEASEHRVATEIDKNNIMVVSNNKNGFQIYLVSHGIRGWRINDELALSFESVSKPFVAQKASVKLKQDDKIDVILVVSDDREIFQVTAYDENESVYPLDGLFNPEGNAYLYYTYSEQPVSGELTYQAYSADGDLLYEE